MKRRVHRGASLALSLSLTTGCLVGEPNPYDEESSGGASSSEPSTGPDGSPTTIEDDAPPGTLRGDGKSAISPSSVCSQASTVSVQLEIINDSPRAVELYWVNYSCEEIDYRSIEQGTSYVQSTFAGHPWRIESEGELLYEYVPTAESRQTLTLR